MKIIRLCAVLLLFCVTLLSCNNKPENTITRYEIIPPEIITADGENLSLSIGGFEISPDEINKKYGKKICGIAGVDFSQQGLSSIQFGENIFGTGLASVVYFGKNADKLNDDEWKLLCSIAENPENFSTALNSENTESINSLLSTHAFQASRIPDSAYYDAMINEVVNDYCQENNCSRNEAFRFIYSEGVTIHTPYSADIQVVVDSVYSDNQNFTSGTSYSFPQSACVILDYNGGVVAIAGGNNNNTVYNRSYRIPHKIGSSIKPIAVYAPAIDSGIINFSSLVPDEPLLLQNEYETIEWPQNYDNIYEGEVTVTAALRKSKNTVAVQLEERLGSQYCLSYLRDNLHFTTLTDNDASPSAMAMGALINGAYLHELAASYIMFGNGGTYCEPYFYSEVLDSDGNVILKNSHESHKAMEKDSAWIMNRLLKYNVSAPDGIASMASLDNITEVIGKTGTVTNSQNEDSGRIFAGATPDYVAAVWVGFDDEESSIENLEYTPPTLIWKNIMKKIPVKNSAFIPDDTVIECVYCTKSGDIASNRCPEVETGFYTEDNMPHNCNMH